MLRKEYEDYKYETEAKIKTLSSDNSKRPEVVQKLEAEISGLYDQLAETRRMLSEEKKARQTAEEERDSANKFAKDTIEINEKLMSELSQGTNHKHHHHHGHRHRNQDSQPDIVRSQGPGSPNLTLRNDKNSALLTRNVTTMPLFPLTTTATRSKFGLNEYF